MTLAERWVALKRRLRLIEDCGAEWRKWSTKIAAAGLALWGFSTALPGYAAQAWAALPADLRAHVPHQEWIGMFLALAFVAKFVRQGAKGRSDD